MAGYILYVSNVWNVSSYDWMYSTVCDSSIENDASFSVTLLIMLAYSISAHFMMLIMLADQHKKDERVEKGHVAFWTLLCSQTRQYEWMTHFKQHLLHAFCYGDGVYCTLLLPALSDYMILPLPLLFVMSILLILPDWREDLFLVQVFVSFSFLPVLLSFFCVCYSRSILSNILFPFFFSPLTYTTSSLLYIHIYVYFHYMLPYYTQHYTPIST